MSESSPALQTIKFSTQLSLDDWNAFLSACSEKSLDKPPLITLLLLVGTPAIAFILAFSFDTTPKYFIYAVLGIAAGLAGLIAWGNNNQKRLSPKLGGEFLSHREYEITSAGLWVRSENIESRLEWRAITDVSNTPDHLFLWLDQGIAEIIPVRELSEHITPSTLLHFIDNARNSSPDNLLETAAPLTSTSINSLFNKISTPAPGVLILLSALAVLTWVALDWQATGPDAVMIPHGIPGILWYALPVVLTAAAWTKTATPELSFRQSLFWILLLVPILLLVNHFSSDYATFAPITGFVALLAAAAITKAATGRVQWLPLVFTAIITTTFLWLTNQVYVSSSVWYAEDSAFDFEDSWEETEQLLFSQSTQIDDIVGKIERPDTISSAFFIGFAGYAEEKVFAEEITFAAKVLGEKYDSKERSLLLLNDIRSTEHAPLATVSGLGHGLQRIAGKMDVANDLLILALSSHGSAAPLLSVSHGLVPLRELDGATLKAQLDNSGIKWRLIIVSACYSGAFIEGLADDNTAILTAAAADRTSFGCSNDRELTYFGEAFYRDALPNEISIRAAFERAKIQLTQRETAEGIEPSNPQAFFGSDIEAKLSEISEQ